MEVGNVQGIFMILITNIPTKKLNKKTTHLSGFF